MPISAVNALTCNMDLIIDLIHTMLSSFVCFTCPLGVGRSKETGVLPAEGVPYIHAMNNYLYPEEAKHSMLLENLRVA